MKEPDVVVAYTPIDQKAKAPVIQVVLIAFNLLNPPSAIKLPFISITTSTKENPVVLAEVV